MQLDNEFEFKYDGKKYTMKRNGDEWWCTNDGIVCSHWRRDKIEDCFNKKVWYDYKSSRWDKLCKRMIAGNANTKI